MRSSPKSVGLFVALVVCALLIVGWPRPDERAAPEPAAEAAPLVLTPDVPRGPTFEVEGDTWRLPRLGLQMRSPEGWTAVERFGRPYLYADPDAPLAGNFNAIWLPNLRGLDHEAMREENRATLERSPDLELIAIEDVDVSGHPALRIDYRGRPKGGEPMRFLGLVMLDGERQLVVTAAVREEDWARLEGEVRKALGTLERVP